VTSVESPTGSPATGSPAMGSPAAGTPGPAGGRRPNRWKAGFFALAVAGMIAAASWAVLGSKFLVVRSVVVTGTHLVPKSQVLAAAGIPEGLPLVRVNTGVSARRIERITQVQSATVSRDWPDRIVITVVERKPVLAVPAGRAFDLIDPTGVIVESVPSRPKGIPQFVPSGPLLHSADVAAAASVLRSLPASLDRQVKAVTVPSVDAVTLELADGSWVDWGTAGQTAQKSHVLAILMHTRAHYYDVSAPGTAVTAPLAGALPAEPAYLGDKQHGDREEHNQDAAGGQHR
jgi:cell division protein FtsQ